jgi:asparagine synthase (glutamine-hydrolysing)
MKKIQLHNNNGFAWNILDGIYAKGYVFAGSEGVLQDHDLGNYFRADTYMEFEEKVKEANGVFTVIVERPGEIWMATDRLRTFPIFYYIKNDNIIVSDSIHQLARSINQPVLDEISFNEFSFAGIVTGCKTLMKNVCQVEAGEVVLFSKTGLKKSIYYHFSKTPSLALNYQDAKAQLKGLLNGVFKEFIDSTQGQEVVIPLSGGFDSRLIACYFKKYAKNNVTCITYGKKNNPEAVVSEKVANSLGFKWKFIEYTDSLIEGFVELKDFQGYYRYAAQMVSMFFLQEYFAVKYLKENKLIENKALFIPGFSADALAGSHLSPFDEQSSTFSRDLFIRQILNKYYIYKDEKVPDALYRKVEDKIKWASVYDHDLFDEWNFTERQAKFINNSARVFEYHGYGFRFPFWDKRLMDFFGSLPLQFRNKKKLYDDYVQDIFKEYHVWFDEDYQVNNRKNKIKKMVKKKFPIPLKKRLLKRNDWQHYVKITSKLIESKQQEKYKIKFTGNSYNEVIIAWYLDEIKKLYKVIK